MSASDGDEFALAYRLEGSGWHPPPPEAQALGLKVLLPSPATFLMRPLDSKTGSLRRSASLGS